MSDFIELFKKLNVNFLLSDASSSSFSPSQYVRRYSPRRKLFEWLIPSVNHVVLSQMASSRFLYLRWRQHARMRKVRVGHQRSRKYFHKLSFVCCRMRIYVIYYPSSMWTQLPRESKVFKNFYWCMFENTSQYQSALSSEQSSVSYSSLLFFTSKGIGTIIAVFHSEIEEIGKIEKTGSNA